MITNMNYSSKTSAVRIYHLSVSY